MIPQGALKTFINDLALYFYRNEKQKVNIAIMDYNGIQLYWLLKYTNNMFFNKQAICRIDKFRLKSTQS